MKPILAVTWRAQAARPGWELLGLEWGLQLLSEMVPGAGSLALLCADPGLFPIRGSGKIPLRLLSKQKGSLGKASLGPAPVPSSCAWSCILLYLSVCGAGEGLLGVFCISKWNIVEIPPIFPWISVSQRLLLTSSDPPRASLRLCSWEKQEDLPLCLTSFVSPSTATSEPLAGVGALICAAKGSQGVKVQWRSLQERGRFFYFINPTGGAGSDGRAGRGLLRNQNAMD